MIESTWETRELPILQYVLEQLDAGKAEVWFGEIRDATGLNPEQVQLGVHALEDAEPPYLRVRWQPYGGSGSSTSGMVLYVTERTRRKLGTWPSHDAIPADIADVLARAADEEPEPERRRLLRQTADGLRGAAGKILVDYLEKKIGL